MQQRIKKLEAAKAYDDPEYEEIAGTLTSFFTVRTPSSLFDTDTKIDTFSSSIYGMILREIP